MNELLKAYFDEAEEILRSLIEQFEAIKNNVDDVPPEIINDIVRKFHTLKGNSYSVGYMKIGDVFHSLEDRFVKIRDGESAITEDVIAEVIAIISVVEDALGQLEAMDAESDTFIEIKVDQFQASKVKVLRAQKEEMRPQDKKKEKEDIRSQLKNLITDENGIALIEELSDSELSALKKSIDQGKAVFCSFIKLSMEADFDEEARKIMEKIRAENFEIISVVTKVEGDQMIFNFIVVPSKDGVDISKLEKIAKSYVLWMPRKVRSTISQQKTSLRVDIEDVEKIMSIISDMVISKNIIRSSLSSIVEESKNLEVEQRLRDSVADLERRMRELQDIVLEMRMLPISDILRGVVRDVEVTAAQLGKLVEVKQSWGNIEIDSEIARKIRNVLLHIARNAVAHGIEYPEERVKKGKPPKGQITISAEKKSGYITIEIRDDGKGIDPKVVVEKYLEWSKRFPELAFSYGLGTSEASFKGADGNWIKEKVFKLLFLPGFSTKDSTDKSAGRGAGLDEVQKEIHSIKGKIEIHSEVGEGTSFVVKIPVAKIVVEAVILDWRGKRYAILLSSVQRTEVYYPEDDRIVLKTMQGRPVAVMGGREFPLVTIDEILGKGSTSIDELMNQKFFILILEGEGKYAEVGLVATDVLEIKDVVMKSFDEEVVSMRGMFAIVEEIGADGQKTIIPVIDALKVPTFIQ